MILPVFSGVRPLPNHFQFNHALGEALQRFWISYSESRLADEHFGFGGSGHQFF